MKPLARILAATFAVAGAAYVPAVMADDDGEVEIQLIHIGDLHGHLIPRANLRSDTSGRKEGGLARLYTKIKSIRGEHPENTLLINTGDTVQGSAETLYTKGQAIVDVLNLFKIDAFAPGNWDFVYGTQRFKDLFVGDPANGVAPLAPWTTVASNVYYDPNNNNTHDAGENDRVTQPYVIKTIQGVKVGILGFTTDRGPQAVGTWVTKGFAFLKSDPGSANIAGSDVSQVEAELQARLAELRPQVDLLVMISELGLANNIVLAERNPGIDVILSSDMHEETRSPVVTSTGTIVAEEGQDGTMLGKLEFEFKKDSTTGKFVVKEWEWKAYTIDDSIAEDATIKAKVDAIRAPFLSDATAKTYVNPFNSSTLSGRIDEVIGNTAVPLLRANFAAEDMPGVIEGSSHDLLTDAFRAVGINRLGAEMDAGTRPSDVLGAIRGFRYGTHVPVGPIKREDLYHYIPIGPKIACGTIEGNKVKNQIENAADGSLNPDPRRWTGGWLFNLSGVTMDLYPMTGATYNADGSANTLNRAQNIQIQNKNGNWSAWNTANKYTYCSYYYDADSTLINRVQISSAYVPTIQIIKDANGNAMDGVEVVTEYIKSLPNMTANPVLHRTTLKEALPPYRFGFPEVQPLKGAQP